MGSTFGSSLFFALPALLFVPVLACSGRVEGQTSTSADASGPRCLDVSLGAQDATCSVDEDCTLALIGHVCSGDCSCGCATVNLAAASRIDAELSPLALSQSCECGFPGYPRCIGGQCVACNHAQGACADAPAGDP